MADSVAVRIGVLYARGISGVEIAERRGIPVRQVYRLLERQGIPRRKIWDSNALRFARQLPTFTVKRKLTLPDRMLMVAGIMLYWAEGAHYASKHVLDFANSNPSMVQTYVKFLREICGVQEERLRVYLYCYANQNQEVLKRFWSKTTGIPLSRFTKPYVRKDFRPEKSGKMPHGLVHIRYADKKLYMQLERWHEEVVTKLLGR